MLADLEAVQHYNPGVNKARYLSANREGVGASRQCDLIPKGWVKERVTEWQPHKAIAMELYESQWPLQFMRWRTMLAPEGGGTRVSQQMEYRLKFGPLGFLLDKLMMSRMLDRTLKDLFQRLKAYVEAGAKIPARAA